MIGGLIGAGLSLAGGFMGKKSAKKQGKLASKGFDWLRNDANVTAARDQGAQAMGLRGALLGLGGDTAAAEAGFQQFQDSTGFQFRMDRGMEGITGSRAAKGILNSGATSKELMAFGQGIGSQEFGNYMNYLGQETDTGLNAAYNVADAAQSAGESQAAAQKAGDDAMAEGIGGAIGNIGSIFGF